MLIDQDKELKNAILNLPAKEKDKMLLKLISKDVVLLNQLRYKLLEADGLEEKRELVIQQIDRSFQHLKKMIVEWPDFVTPGQLMMGLRDMSGYVNDHISITNDKLGDIELRLYIIESLLGLKLDVLKDTSKKNQKLLAYLAGRINYILDKYQKLHEDYQFDLKERLNKILVQINQSAVRTFAEELMLPQSV